MHETVLASSLLSILQETVAKHVHEGRDLRIEEAVVTVGVLACVEPQTLRGCFEIMAEGTVAQEAVLTIVTRPMKGICPDCAQTVETVERRFSCPLCQGTQVDWQDGRGMEITSIRVVENEVGEGA